MHGMCLILKLTVQCTQHGGDDYDKIIKGDPGLESIYEWTKSGPAVPFRGATGKGDGVHVLSGSQLPSVFAALLVQACWPAFSAIHTCQSTLAVATVGLFTPVACHAMAAA